MNEEVYCMRCRKKVPVKDGTVVEKESKYGGIRYFLKGKCQICDSNINGLIKNPLKSRLSQIN